MVHALNCRLAALDEPPLGSATQLTACRTARRRSFVTRSARRDGTPENSRKMRYFRGRAPSARRLKSPASTRNSNRWAAWIAPRRSGVRVPLAPFPEHQCLSQAWASGPRAGGGTSDGGSSRGQGLASASAGQRDGLLRPLVLVLDRHGGRAVSVIAHRCSRPARSCLADRQVPQQKPPLLTSYARL
jgi:hypothetical protein